MPTNTIRAAVAAALDDLDVAREHFAVGGPATPAAPHIAHLLAPHLGQGFVGGGFLRYHSPLGSRPRSHFADGGEIGEALSHALAVAHGFGTDPDVERAIAVARGRPQRRDGGELLQTDVHGMPDPLAGRLHFDDGGGDGGNGGNGGNGGSGGDGGNSGGNSDGSGNSNSGSSDATGGFGGGVGGFGFGGGDVSAVSHGTSSDNTSSSSNDTGAPAGSSTGGYGGFGGYTSSASVGGSYNGAGGAGSYGSSSVSDGGASPSNDGIGSVAGSFGQNTADAAGNAMSNGFGSVGNGFGGFNSTDTANGVGFSTGASGFGQFGSASTEGAESLGMENPLGLTNALGNGLNSLDDFSGFNSALGLDTANPDLKSNFDNVNGYLSGANSYGDTFSGDPNGYVGGQSMYGGYDGEPGFSSFSNDGYGTTGAVQVASDPAMSTPFAGVTTPGFGNVGAETMGAAGQQQGFGSFGNAMGLGTDSATTTGEYGPNGFSPTADQLGPGALSPTTTAQTPSDSFSQGVQAGEALAKGAAGSALAGTGDAGDLATTTAPSTLSPSIQAAMTSPTVQNARDVAQAVAGVSGANPATSMGVPGMGYDAAMAPAVSPAMSPYSGVPTAATISGLPGGSLAAFGAYGPNGVGLNGVTTASPANPAQAAIDAGFTANPQMTMATAQQIASIAGISPQDALAKIANDPNYANVKAALTNPGQYGAQLAADDRAGATDQAGSTFAAGYQDRQAGLNGPTAAVASATAQALGNDPAAVNSMLSTGATAEVGQLAKGIDTGMGAYAASTSAPTQVSTGAMFSGDGPTTGTNVASAQDAFGVNGGLGAAAAPGDPSTVDGTRALTVHGDESEVAADGVKGGFDAPDGLATPAQVNAYSIADIAGTPGMYGMAQRLGLPSNFSFSNPDRVAAGLYGNFAQEAGARPGTDDTGLFSGAVNMAPSAYDEGLAQWTGARRAGMAGFVSQGAAIGGDNVSATNLNSYTNPDGRVAASQALDGAYGTFNNQVGYALGEIAGAPNISYSGTYAPSLAAVNVPGTDNIAATATALQHNFEGNQDASTGRRDASAEAAMAGLNAIGAPGTPATGAGSPGASATTAGTPSTSSPETQAEEDAEVDGAMTDDVADPALQTVPGWMTALIPGIGLGKSVMGLLGGQPAQPGSAAMAGADHTGQGAGLLTSPYADANPTGGTVGGSSANAAPGGSVNPATSASSGAGAYVNPNIAAQIAMAAMTGGAASSALSPSIQAALATVGQVPNAVDPATGVTFYNPMLDPVVFNALKLARAAA